MSATMDPGKVIGVAGNTMAHAKELIELVYVAAKQLNVNVSHVTFKPIGADELGAGDKTKH